MKPFAKYLNEKKYLIPSPLDVLTFFITINAVKGKPFQDSLKDELKGRYPGDLSKVHIDYAHHKNGQGIALIAKPETIDKAKAERRIIISGISLMLEASKKYADQKNCHVLTAIATPLWFEVISMKDGMIHDHTAVAGNKSEDWLEAINNLSIMEDRPKLILILKETSKEDPAPQRILESFPEARVMDLRDTLLQIKRKDHALFKPRSKMMSTPSLILLCLVVHSLTFLGSLLILEGKAEGHLARLTSAWEDQKAKALLFDELQKNMDTPRKSDALSVIRELCRAAPDGWINRLVIGDDRFDIEAEGEDSCEISDRLNSSPLFSEVTLHEARPSPLKGEIFSLSGRIIHE